MSSPRTDPADEMLLWGPREVRRKLPGNLSLAAATEIWTDPTFPGVTDVRLGPIVVPSECRRWAEARVADLAALAAARGSDIPATDAQERRDDRDQEVGTPPQRPAQAAEFLRQHAGRGREKVAA